MDKITSSCCDDKNESAGASCCPPKAAVPGLTMLDASCAVPEKKLPSFAEGWVSTPGGDIPRVRTELDSADRRGAIKSRLSNFRMSFTVEPGLYAVGNPDHNSEVILSANYKLSFDHLRRELAGLDLWIIVLDTLGINVWCAAGKRTFGTDEIIKRVKEAGLSEMVSHKRLVLPQLGGPGVQAHEVKKSTGFRVHYG
ncbi:MAG: hypothetical protein KAR83_10470, partial [Thermodesulfovibrionales bacterium]|nr:hypothetical protein [Thermodesulfovibrionales bacterium]